MNCYPSYKPSGVKWLGEIPSHWEVKHLRNFLTLFSEKGYGNSQLLSVTREKGVILRDKENKEENHNFVPDDLSGYKHLEAGDFVINKMKSWQGSYGVSDYEGIVSPAYFTCKLHGVNPQFFSCAIRSKAYVGFFMQYSKGIRVDQWDLDPSSMKDIPFVLPSPDEQSAIAVYLDTATAKIDAAIAQQQKMIDLLNERKQIIINRAVTKGLNPNAKMKDSGVEWIGEVPEDWEVRRLKHIAKLQSGDTISSDSFTETGYPVFGGNGFRGYTNRFTNDGDYVLIGRQGALCGNVNYAHGQFFASEHAVVVYPYHKENLVWLGEVIRASNLNQYSQSAAQPGLAVSLIQNICYPYPPKEERDEIALYIEKNIKVMEAGIKNYQQQISLLQERKQIIINEVVTGKVKVR